MRDPPPDVAASWPTPNYVNPAYRGPQLAIVGILLIVLSFLLLSLRIWVRTQLKKTAGWDDGLMVAAMVLTVASTASSIVGTHHGWGHHIWDFKPEWHRPSRMLSWINQLMYIFIMGLVKVSLLCSYLRFSTTWWLPRFSWVLIAVNVAWVVAFVVALALACKPLNRYWDGVAFTGHCSGESARLISASITSIVTDVLVLALPLPTFWKLQLPMREKVVLLTLMSMGVLACAASIARTYYIAKTTIYTYDVSWDGYNIWLWTVVEINLAIICASVPTLRPFARRYLPGLGIRRSSDQSQHTAHMSDWHRGPAGIQVDNMSGQRLPVQLHQVIPPVVQKSNVARSASNSSENHSLDGSKHMSSSPC